MALYELNEAELDAVSAGQKGSSGRFARGVFATQVITNVQVAVAVAIGGDPIAINQATNGNSFITKM